MENPQIGRRTCRADRCGRGSTCAGGTCRAVVGGMSSSSSSVTVAVRVRPFNGREKEQNSKCIIRMQARGTCHYTCASLLLKLKAELCVGHLLAKASP